MTIQGNAHSGRSRSDPSAPRYGLIVLGFLLMAGGIALVAFGHGILDKFWLGLWQECLISIALTLVLYGLYPVAAAKGDFTQGAAKLAVYGPAAIGLFLFLVLLFLLPNYVKQLDAGSPHWIVLQLGDDQTLRTAQLEDGSQVCLLDVDSFKPKELWSVVNRAYQTVRSGLPGMPIATVTDETGHLLRTALTRLDIGEDWTRAADSLVNEALRDTLGAARATIDQTWADRVEAIRLQGLGEVKFERIKTMPYALVRVTTGGSSRVEGLAPGASFPVGGRQYFAPVIANPRLTVVKDLREAVVLAHT